jgi:hypothetical protein
MLARMVAGREEADYLDAMEQRAEAEVEAARAAAGIDPGLWDLFRVSSHATQRACERQREEEEAAGLPESGAFVNHYPACLVEATAALCRAYGSRAADGGLALGLLYRAWWPTPLAGRWPDRLPQPPDPPREPAPPRPAWWGGGP